MAIYPLSIPFSKCNWIWSISNSWICFPLRYLGFCFGTINMVSKNCSDCRFPHKTCSKVAIAFFLVLWFWSRMWYWAEDKAAQLKYTLSHRKHVCASLLKKVSAHRMKFGNLCRTGQQPAYFIICSHGSNAFSSGLLIAWFWLMSNLCLNAI